MKIFKTQKKIPKVLRRGHSRTGSILSQTFSDGPRLPGVPENETALASWSDANRVSMDRIEGLGRSENLAFRVLIRVMVRLNSGIKDRHNFFMWAIFLFEKLGTDSVNYADSGDIKILVWFPGKSILKFAIIFWKCVGGAQMCGCNIIKIAQYFNLITPNIFICKIRGTYLILPKPTQFQPT